MQLRGGGGGGGAAGPPPPAGGGPHPPRPAPPPRRPGGGARDAYLQDYLDTRAELERVRAQHQAVVEALRTIQDAGAGNGVASTGSRAARRSRRAEVAPPLPGRADGPA